MTRKPDNATLLSLLLLRGAVLTEHKDAYCRIGKRDVGKRYSFGVDFFDPHEWSNETTGVGVSYEDAAEDWWVDNPKLRKYFNEA